MVIVVVIYVVCGLLWCAFMNWRVARHTSGALTQAHDRHHALLWPVSIAAFCGHRLGRRG